MTNNGRNTKRAARIKYGYLPLSRILKDSLAKRNMNVQALKNLLGCSLTYANDILQGHRKPSETYRLTLGVILGWVKKIDGSIINDKEGIIKVHDYFSGTDSHSTAEEVSEKMLAEETKKRLRIRKRNRKQQVQRTATIKAEKEAKEKYGTLEEE